MSKKIIYTCDKCKKEITGESIAGMVGGGTLVTLYYEGEVGNNQFPFPGWHLHYACALPIVRTLRKNILGAD